MPIDPQSLISATVYSVVWPDTEALVRRCYIEDADAMLDAHRNAHTKRQDAMHEPFFEAWARFAEPALAWTPKDFPEHYPTAGSSEAIREIIREQAWKRQDLVVFDGDYEGYEAIAAAQGTTVHRVDRTRWREILARWLRQAPWGPEGAVWWVSQPSALDGNTWPDFDAWLDAVGDLGGACRVWADLTYVGRARLAAPIRLSHPAIAGLVFSLSKVMGAYYRRIGGCFSREPLPGLWANRWFKNLDSLYIGRRWLEQAGDAMIHGQRYGDEQRQAMALALNAMGGKAAWAERGVVWRPSDVSLLMHAADPAVDVGADAPFAKTWQAAARGTTGRAARRLCLTPALCSVLGLTQPHPAEVLHDVPAPHGALSLARA